MGVEYKAVLWNRQKKRYDGLILALLIAYIAVFAMVTSLVHPEVAPPTLIIRTTGSLALLLLHIILIIGPLSRLDSRFLPLLYNRRHLGVTMFFIALVHGGFSILQFHAFGDVNPIVSVITSNVHYGNLMRFPFQSLGLVALVILFLMAASSHDFWLHNLSPRVWKGLHMMVYLAYVLIIMHVMLGVVQLEDSPWLIGTLGLGMLLVLVVHLLSAARTFRSDQSEKTIDEAGFVYAGEIDEIEEGRARLLRYQDHSMAVYKYQDKISVVDNACKHQSGPLSEGKIVDGCITCPWHGYQYLPESGSSPPPFEEKICTYNVKLAGNSIWVDPHANPPGTAVPAALIKYDA